MCQFGSLFIFKMKWWWWCNLLIIPSQSADEPTPIAQSDSFILVFRPHLFLNCCCCFEVVRFFCCCLFQSHSRSRSVYKWRSLFPFCDCISHLLSHLKFSVTSTTKAAAAAERPAYEFFIKSLIFFSSTVKLSPKLNKLHNFFHCEMFFFFSFDKTRTSSGSKLWLKEKCPPSTFCYRSISVVGLNVSAAAHTIKTHLAETRGNIIIVIIIYRSIVSAWSTRNERINFSTTNP